MTSVLTFVFAVLTSAMASDAAVVDSTGCDGVGVVV